MSTEISVHEGVANVNPSIFKHRLVASTCPTTLPRDGASVEHSFRFMPKKDSTNDLVLVECRHSDCKPRLDLYHITRTEDGKVMVKENPRDIRDMVGAEFGYQVRDSSIELRIRKTRFTSDVNAVADGESVMVVDAESILKFIAGYIGIRKLRSAGRLLQKRRDTLRELQVALAFTEAALDDCRTDLERECQKRFTASVETETLRKKLREFRDTVHHLYRNIFPFLSRATALREIDKILHERAAHS